jgi:hypothetical protein
MSLSVAIHLPTASGSPMCPKSEHNRQPLLNHLIRWIEVNNEIIDRVVAVIQVIYRDMRECLNGMMRYLGMKSLHEYIVFTMITSHFLILIVIYRLSSNPPIVSNLQPELHASRSATQNPLLEPRASRPIPPHVILQQYIHPSTSLWPAYYLQAFHRAEKDERRLVLDKRIVEGDLRCGRVILRDKVSLVWLVHDMGNQGLIDLLIGILGTRMAGG